MQVDLGQQRRLVADPFPGAGEHREGQEALFDFRRNEWSGLCVGDLGRRFRGRRRRGEG